MLHFRLFKIMVFFLWGVCAAREGVSAESADNAAAAKMLFTKGEELFAEGAYLEAAAAFQGAYDLAPHQAALSNVGYCYEYGNKPVKAVAVYNEYLAASFEKDPETVADIRTRLVKLQHLVGQLHIQCHPDDCTVDVDDVPKGKTKGGELVVVVAPGSHTVTVRGIAGTISTGDYQVAAAEDVEARFMSGEEDEAESPMSVETPPSPETSIETDTDGETGYRNASKIAFYALSGGALASGIVMSVFGGLTLASKKEYEASEYRDPEARDATKRNKVITNVSLGLASAMAVGAVAVKLLDIRSGKREKQRSSLSLRLTAGNVVSIQGRF